MTTLLALYRRPEGGDEAYAEFERAYAETHLPLVAQTPGLRGLRLQRVRRGLSGPTDLALVAAMEFDDWESLKSGLGSDAMKAAGENLAQIAPGMSTLIVLEDAPELVPEGWR